MRAFSLLAFSLAVLCSGIASAELFPNAFWNQTKQVAASQSCQNGSCLNESQTVFVLPQQNRIPQFEPSYRASFDYHTLSSGFAIGARDKDGMVITSIDQPTTAPIISASTTISLLPVSILEVAQEASRADLRQFRMALRAAIAEAARQGSITSEDARELRRASFSPAFAREAERLAVIQMVVSGENSELVPRDEDGKVVTAGINWGGVGKFLQLLLPILLEFLKGLGL